MKKVFAVLMLIAIVMTIIASFAGSVNAATFNDVGDDEIYKTGIEFLHESGIVNGNPDGSFKPLDSLNRAEMLKIIAEGSAQYSGLGQATFDSYAGKSCFIDVKANQWYTKYVCYGKEKGWVIGYDNGKYFRPSQKVTFVEALKITFNGFDLGYTENSSPWYKDAVNKASEKNYIPHTIFAFEKPLIRNQMADMIARIINSKASVESLEDYLGARADIVVSYETISKGQDLSQLEVEVIDAN
ncbi:MAG: S-layer homology domain-containing protein [Patescibacteria group bacterium]